MLTAPITTVSLTDDILFTVRIRTYSGTKSNNKKASEYSANEGAKKKVMGVSEDLFVDDHKLRAVRNYRQTVDNWGDALGAPWGVKHYLPGILIPRLMQEYDEHKTKFMGLVQAWVGTEAEYNQRISDFAFQRGNLFDRAQYPTYADVLSRFSIDLFIEPVPATNVIVQKFSALSDDLHKHYQRQHQQQLQGVMGKLSADMLKVLSRLSKATTDTTVKNKQGKHVTKHGRVFESTLDLANHITQTFKDFNLTQDPALEEARLKLEQVMRGVTVDNLRTGSTLRRKVKDTVDEMLRAFAPTAVQTIASSGMSSEELGIDEDDDFTLPEAVPEWTNEDEYKAEIAAERNYEEMTLAPVIHKPTLIDALKQVDEDFLSLLKGIEDDDSFDLPTDNVKPMPEFDMTIPVPAQEDDTADMFAMFNGAE